MRRATGQFQRGACPACGRVISLTLDCRRTTWHRCLRGRVRAVRFRR